MSILIKCYKKRECCFIPATRKESLYFGLMMCFGMVVCMSTYNLYINGAFGHITIVEGLLGSLIGFVIAMLLDLYLVGPMAKKLTFKLLGKSKNVVLTVLTLSTVIVFGMALFMSMYGLATTYVQGNSSTETIIQQYFTIFGKNFIVALPLQLLVVGPIVRFIFTKYIKNKQNDTTSHT